MVVYAIVACIALATLLGVLLARLDRKILALQMQIDELKRSFIDRNDSISRLWTDSLNMHNRHYGLEQFLGVHVTELPPHKVSKFEYSLKPSSRLRVDDTPKMEKNPNG